MAASRSTFTTTASFNMSLPTNDNGAQHIPTSTDTKMTSSASDSNGAGQSERYEPTFVCLPPELKRMIVHSSDDSSLPNLRLTCKELNEIASKPFGERCLAERRFMFTKYSMQGLLELTAHPIFGPCVRKISFNTHRITDADYWLETVGKLLPEEDRQATCKVVQAAAQDMKNLFKSKNGKAFKMLTQASLNLKKHGQQVTLGVFDDVIHRDSEDEMLRKAYGFDECWGNVWPPDIFMPGIWEPIDDLALGIIAKVLKSGNIPLPPLEMDLAKAPRSGSGNLGKLLTDTVMKHGKLHRHVDVFMDVASDWTFRFWRPYSNRDHLAFHVCGTLEEICEEDEIDPDFVPDVYKVEGHELRYDYGSGNCSSYSPCEFGDFNKAIRSEELYEIAMASFATEAHFIAYGICSTGGEKLQKLTMVDAHLFGPGSHGFVDENGSAWPYLSVFKDLLRDNCPNLRSLVFERVYYHVEGKPMGRSVITEQRRKWKGKDGVLSGLACLIAEMTTLDEEQQQRWFKHEIDADGNDLVATVEDE
ncbi:hypothetical protein D6D26_03137 [Aureobasidium pullulans]|nr:hypothetical protein D6D26_03137 [Aureobasidium pullulans]